MALRKRYSYLAEPGISPQTPCEQTDIRTAIVADHLGLSWTELARELNFSVDDINQIRVENPNSLTTQSFILLKKWVFRDGKDATTDVLSRVLKKINRMDIVTLLEGPIFDYGNISGTRSFADDSCVFLDQSDVPGWHSDSSSVDVEPPTPRRCNLSTDNLDEDNGNLQEQRIKNDLAASVMFHMKGQVLKPKENGDHDIHRLDRQRESGHAPSGPLIQEVGGDLPVTPQDRKTLNGKVHKRSVLITEQAEPVTELQKDLAETRRPGVDEYVSPLFGSERKTSWSSEVLKSGPNFRDDGSSPAEHKAQGEDAKKVPGEMVTQEQFVDDDGNVVTRKVTRTVVSRLVLSPDREREDDDLGRGAEDGAGYFGSGVVGPEQVEGYKVIRVKKETRQADKKTH